MATTVGIAGGTGALGRGLAARWAVAGVPVRLGSRDAARGEAAAAELNAELPTDAVTVEGGHLSSLTDRDVVVLAVPYDSVAPTLAALADLPDGRLVVSALNPLAFDADGPHVVASDVEESIAEQVAATFPTARVVGAFHTVSSRQLARLDRPMDEDVPVVSDDEDAMATVVALADRIEGCRGVAVGRLRLAATLEALTPVLISVNKRHGAHTGIRFSGLEIG